MGSEEWDVFVGSALVQDSLFEGKVKDVRLWNKMRTEQELYSYRFRQVDAQPELSLNAKMMDGSRLVINEAVVDELGDLTKAVEPVGYQLVASNFENLVCPAFTFFNPE